MNVHKNHSHRPARSSPLSRTGLGTAELSNASLLFLLSLCTLEKSVIAQDQPQTSPPPNPPAATSEASAGLLPVPDYSGGFGSRKYLSGDWGGARTDLANKGVQFDV